MTLRPSYIKGTHATICRSDGRLPQVDHDPLELRRLGKKGDSESEGNESEDEQKAVQANSFQKDCFSTFMISMAIAFQVILMYCC